MSQINWSDVPHFKCGEFDDPNHPGSGDMIDRKLLRHLVALRVQTGWPVIIHGAVGGAVDVDGSWGHADASYHLQKQGCKAVDWHFVADVDVRTQAFLILQAGFRGVGFYYDWHWNGELLSIGFHTDMRPLGRTQVWKRVDGEYIYLLR